MTIIKEQSIVLFLLYFIVTLLSTHLLYAADDKLVKNMVLNILQIDFLKLLLKCHPSVAHELSLKMEHLPWSGY